MKELYLEKKVLAAEAKQKAGKNKGFCVKTK